MLKMDNFATTKNDMLLLNKLFGNLDAATLPASFKLGKTEYKGISEDFSPSVRKRLVDSNICETIITGRNSKGVEVRAEIVEYRDFPVVEWQLFFENTSGRTSEVLSELNPIDYLFPAKKATLQHGNGDTRKRDAFETFETPIGKEPTVIAPCHGVSCEGAFPFMRLCLDNYIVNMIGKNNTPYPNIPLSQIKLTNKSTNNVFTVLISTIPHYIITISLTCTTWKSIADTFNILTLPESLRLI